MFATHSNAGIQASSIDNFPFVLLGGMSSPIVEGLKNAIPFRGMFFCIAAEDIWRIPSGNSGIFLLSNNQPRVSQSTLTFEEFIETKYMPFVEKRKRSFATDRRLLKRYVYPAFASKRLTELTTEEIEGWKEAFRERGFAPSSVNRVLAVIKYALQCAVSWSMIERNPAKGVSNYPLLAPKERHLTIAEARRLVRILERSTRQEAKAIELLLLTGARKSEILNARWEDVSFTERILTVPLSKSGKTRFIPLSREAIRVLQSLRQGRETNESWIFPQKRNSQPIQSVWKVWRQARKEAGLTDVRLHDLRHSFASFLINSGRTLYEVQKILGHGTPAVTMRYAHLDNRTLLSAVNNIATAIAPRPHQCPSIV